MAFGAVFQHRLACRRRREKVKDSMLLSFRFANHRSFRDEQQLNLLPVYDADPPDEGAELEAVPVAGIFGANASGKSNVISALSYMSRMVGESDRESEPGLGPRRQPFRLDPEISAQPSSYAVDLMLEGVRHTYGFRLDSKQVLEEWLYSYPLRRKRVIFERTEQHFDWGEEARRSSAPKLAGTSSLPPPCSCRWRHASIRTTMLREAATRQPDPCTAHSHGYGKRCPATRR